MFQKIDGHFVFVANITVAPQTLLPIHDGGNRLLRPYADALQEAILKGIVKEPGKYGIELQYPFIGGRWNIYAINE